MVPHESGKHLVARFGLDSHALVDRAAGSEIFVVAGACYGLVQYSRFSPRSTSAGPSCRQAAAATATNSHPTTLCPLNGVLAGAAANAGPIAPLPGVANGLACALARFCPLLPLNRRRSGRSEWNRRTSGAPTGRGSGCRVTTVYQEGCKSLAATRPGADARCDTGSTARWLQGAGVSRGGPAFPDSFCGRDFCGRDKWSPARFGLSRSETPPRGERRGVTCSSLK